MKKQIITLLMLCMFASVSAQFLTKGTHVISGSFGYSSYTEKMKYDGTTTTYSKNTEVSFLPSYGYLVIDNLVVGGAMNFESDVTKYEEDDEKDTQTIMTIGPVVRYYFADMGIFAMGYYGFGSATEKSEYMGQSNETKYGLSEWRLGAGYSVKLSDTVLLDPVISYGSTTWKDKDSDITWISSGHLMINVGFTVFFPK